MRKLVVLLVAVMVLGWSIVSFASSDLLVSPNITATVYGPREVIVSWEPAPGETQGYEVIRSTADYPNWLQALGTVAANVYSFTDYTAQPGTTYNYAVTPNYLQSQSRGMDYRMATVTTPTESSTSKSTTTTQTVEPTIITPTTATSQNTITTKVIIGKKEITINENTVPIDVAPKIENGRTLVPLRAISEALGAKVEWDEKTQTITISIEQGN